MSDYPQNFTHHSSQIQNNFISLLHNSICLDAQLLVIQRLTSFDVKFPLVPGAFEDFALAFVRQLGEGGGNDQRAQSPLTERPTPMWAEVAQGVESTVDVEDADLATINRNDLTAARRQVRGPSDNVAIG